MEPTFRHSRDITVYQAFENLFTEPLSVNNQFRRDGTGKLYLTILDIFLLIHSKYRASEQGEDLLTLGIVLYTYISLHINVSMPLVDSRSSEFPDSATLARIKTALDNWRSLWLTLRVQIPGHVWASTGFFKSSYNYWLVAQLLLSKKESIDVLKNIDVKCDDKLRHLKVLLSEGNNRSSSHKLME